MKTEPEWWAEARALREQGLSTGQIGKRLGRAWGRVRYALDPTARADERAAARARYRRRPLAISDADWQRLAGKF